MHFLRRQRSGLRDGLRNISQIRGVVEVTLVEGRTLAIRDSCGVLLCP